MTYVYGFTLHRLWSSSDFSNNIRSHLRQLLKIWSTFCLSSVKIWLRKEVYSDSRDKNVLLFGSIFSFRVFELEGFDEERTDPLLMLVKSEIFEDKISTQFWFYFQFMWEVHLISVFFFSMWPIIEWMEGGTGGYHFLNITRWSRLLP